MISAGDNRARLLALYATMSRIRAFEETALAAHRAGEIPGPLHVSIGQEAVAAGVCLNLRQDDRITSNHRGHGHALAKGAGVQGMMEELLGRAGGHCRGKGGSMHMFSTEAGFFGGHGIVGAQVSLGTGLALANQYKANGNVAFVYFGDGAANQGQVYESFNMAALWKLPVVYVIENNQYAMGTSIERASAETHLYRRGVSFNIPGEEVDGMDVEAVREAGARAAAFAREGNGPYILEMKTYRYRGHSMSDPAKYRTKEEVDEVKKTRDPIDHLREVMETKGWADETALKAFDAEVKAIVADAAEFARTSPEPDPAELYTDVYLEAAQ